MKTKSSIDSPSLTYSIAFLIVFLGSLLLPLLTVSDKVSVFLDTFKGKTKFINIYTEFRLAVGDRIFNRSIVAHDGWFTLTDGYAMADYQNVPLFTSVELRKIKRALEDFQMKVEANGGTFVFVVPPDKQNIYPEHVPGIVPRNQGTSRLDQLITFLATKRSPVHIVDLRPVLLDAKQTYPVYFVTDSHWTPVGAFFAYQKIMATLQPSFPGLSSHALSEYKMTKSQPILLDMAKSIGTTSRVEAPLALVPTYQPQATMFSIEIPTEMGPRLLLFSQTDDKNAPTALVFYDSFSIALRPFLAEHFSRAVYIDYLAAGGIPYLTWYKQFQPDIVIFEMTERSLGSIPSLFGTK